jgi:hypothetical protein
MCTATGCQPNCSWQIYQYKSNPVTGPVWPRGTRRWWVVSSTPRPYFTPGKDPVPPIQEGGWASGTVWQVRKISRPLRFDPRIVHPVSQSLYRLSYPAHNLCTKPIKNPCTFSKCILNKGYLEDYSQIPLMSSSIQARFIFHKVCIAPFNSSS